MEQAVTFGGWLKARRRALDLSREALAELVSCAPPTLAKIEQGTRRPSRELAALLLDALQISSAEREIALRLARSPLAAGETAPLPAQSEEQDDLPRADYRLPAPPTPLVGRHAELRLLRERLTNPACRIVTLVGYGGAGKSRLALEAAIELGAHFRDGAVWVELAAVSSAEEVAPAVAHALGYARRDAGPLDAEVLTFLRERHMLLVLDNLEHLPGAAPFLSMIVRGASQLTLLLTSRRPLHLAGEWVVVLEGLPMPPPESTPNLERYDAARLFLERAVQAGVAVAANPASRQAVAQICRALDGFPLAIELAATWSRVLSCEAIAAELAHNLALLAAPVTGEQSRHGSMGAVFAQSWSLLGEQERRALAALSIFQGDFTREAAAQVAGASLSILATLIDMSLLRRGSVRYQMHALVRQFAAEQLDQASEAVARAAHAAYYAQLLAASAPRLQGSEQLPTLALLDLERANIVQAWAWAVDQGVERMLVQSAPGLLLMHELRGRIREAANLFSGSVARRRAGRAEGSSTGGDRALGVLCAWEGWARGRYGETSAGGRLLAEAVALLDGDDDLLATTGVLGSLGLILLQQGRYAEAGQFLERSLGLVTPRGLHFFATLHSVFLLNVRLAEGDREGAASLGELAIMHSHAGGGPRARLLGRCGAALTAAMAGRVERAQELAREALALAASAHDPFGLGLALLMLGIAARLGGDLEEARYLLAESAETCANVGDRWNQGRALVHLGAAARGAGDDDAARGAWIEALRVTLDHGIDSVAMSAAVELAALRITDMPEVAYPLVAALRARPEADYAVRARSTAILAGATHSALHDAQGIAAEEGEMERLARFVARYPAIFAYT